MLGLDEGDPGTEDRDGIAICGALRFREATPADPTLHGCVGSPDSEGERSFLEDLQGAVRLDACTERRDVDNAARDGALQCESDRRLAVEASLLGPVGHSLLSMRFRDTLSHESVAFSSVQTEALHGRAG